MTTWVFSLGLIPVQEWIAEARRSRDLRAGSVFLWWMMAKVLARMEQEGARFLLPRPPKTPTDPDDDDPGGFARLASLPFHEALDTPYGLPNRASGWLEADETALRGLLGGLREHVVEATWADWKRTHLPPAEQPGDAKDFWRAVELWVRQYHQAIGGPAADCPLSLVWVARPWDGGKPEDGAWLDEVDRDYAQVKRTRPLRPWRGGAAVGKCNQCARREALGPAQVGFEGWRDELDGLDGLPWLKRGFRVDAGERLCYVCLTRRIAAYAHEEERPARRRPDHRFPSTGEVAARPWLARLHREAEHDDCLAKRLKNLEENRLGREDLGRALFLGQAALEESEHTEAARLRRELKEEIGKLNRARREAGAEGLPIPEEPCPHLALMTFDGDDMGRHVRADAEGMARRMGDFQDAAGQLFKTRGTAVFYLGGDEGLAMAPAAAALPLALEVRETFARVFEGTLATVSLGLAFFDQSRPMAGAIRAAREALRRAKAREGKSALAVAVETASGNRWWVGPEPWGAFWARLAKAASEVRAGRLAAGWAYDVECFLESLGEETWAALAHDPAPVRAEVKRLLLRRLLGIRGEERRSRTETLWEDLEGESWWAGSGGPPPAAGPEQFHLVGFLGRLDPQPEADDTTEGSP